MAASRSGTVDDAAVSSKGDDCASAAVVRTANASATVIARSLIARPPYQNFTLGGLSEPAVAANVSIGLWLR